MNRRSILAVIALATSLLLPPAVSADGEKVLVLCNDGLAAHATAITAGITMFREYGLAYGFQVDTTTSVSAFTASNLANYSAVALLDATSNTFDESQKTAFQDFFRSGKGFIGIHSFERNFLDWTWYRDLIGISYVFDDGYANMNFYVNDTGSALSRGVPRTFVSQQQLRVDSLFFTSATPEYTVVLRSDSASNQNIPGDTINPYRQPFFPYVWTHRYDGGGPVWCALPGHLPATFSTDTAFRKLMLRGILYALNRSPESGPSAPFLASPANGWTSELTTVTLAWNSAGGATSYTVQVSNGSTFAATVAANTGAAVSAAIGGLAANADYYWRVRAANATNTGGWSAVWRFTTMDYRSWNYSRDFGLNTSPSGAAITAAQYNFPVLVRLTSANAAAVFSQAKTDGSDLRFAKTDGTVLPYQLSRYDQARQRACAWVRLDTVQANGTSQRIAMYWGKDGVASRSDSGAVFGTSYGFASVLHLNKTDRDSSNSMHLFADATGRYTARSSSTTTDTDGVFDRARYLHCSGTATANYAGDSIVISGMLGSPQQVTLSAWVRIDSIDQQNRTSGILGIASTVFLRDNGGAANDSMQVGGCFGSAFAWGSWPTSGHGLLRQGWKHVAGVVNAASSGAYVKWYMNGDSVLFFAPATQGTLTYPQNSGVNYVIGRHTGGTPSAGRKMGGSIMEARVDRVVRSSDWIRLCYRNQGPNDYLFDYSPLPRQPLLSSPADNAADRPVSLTLGWNAVPGAVSYTVQAATAASFGAAVEAEFAGVTTTAQAATLLRHSAAYYWRVNATNGAGSGPWSAVWSFTTELGAPGAPVLAAPSDGQADLPVFLTLSWNSVAYAASYAGQLSLASDFSVVAEGGVTPDTAQAIGPMDYATTYYWRGRAINAAGSSDWSAGWSFTTVPLPPPPVLESPLDGAPYQSLATTLSWGSWSRVGESPRYGVHVSTSSGFDVVAFSQEGLTATAIAVAPLAANTLYFWRVRGANESGSSAWTAGWSFTTLGIPPSPSPLSPVDNAQNQPLLCSLTWGTVPAAAAYSVQLAAVSDFSATVLSQDGLTATTAAAGPLGEGTAFYWRVSAANEAGSGAWCAAWRFTTVVNPPASPLLAMPSDNAVNLPFALTLAWNSVAQATAYWPQVAIDSAFTGIILSDSTAGGLSAPLSGLSPQTACWWRVRAKNSAGFGAWSAAWRFTTAKLQVIPLAKNWNMKSLNVTPLDDTTAAVFGTGAGANFLFVKDNAGRQYCPPMGIDQIRRVRVGQGYQLYVDTTGYTLRVAGATVEVAATPIALNAAWNIIAYLPQAADSTHRALADIASTMMLLKNNNGRVYWPEYGIADVDVLMPGEGYKLLMAQADSLTYPTASAKRNAAGQGREFLRLPDPRHYPAHANTGENATILATCVALGNRPAPDNSEIAAYDGRGRAVGSGSVLRGRAAFAVWGDNLFTKETDGCAPAEKLAFRLWDGANEYPLSFVADKADAAGAAYSADAVLRGRFMVAEGYLIKKFDLAKVYPNPFRGRLRVAFDVPAIGTAARQQVEIGLYDLKGNLVQRLASGRYPAGRHVVTADPGATGALGSNVYLLRMKADNFDKRVKVMRIR